VHRNLLGRAILYLTYPGKGSKMELLAGWFDDKELTEADFESGRIVSLWDMLRFQAEKLIAIHVALTVLSRAVEVINAGESKGDLRLDTEIDTVLISWPQTQEYVKELHNSLLSLGLLVSASAAAMLLKPRDTKDKRRAINRMKFEIDHLIFTIQSELEGRASLMIPVDRSPFYEMKDTFLGEDVIKKFPALTEDACEAGNCFGLGRYTACVFHLMRVMERPVQQLGKTFKINNLHKKPWGQILNEVKPKIDKMPHGTPKQERKQNKFNHNYQLLDAICRATRNPTMHPKITDIKQTYTEDEARDLMDRVKSFMEDFVKLR
jgi:hypothetical protein